jgi:hypothetical protein
MNLPRQHCWLQRQRVTKQPPLAFQISGAGHHMPARVTLRPGQAWQARKKLAEQAGASVYPYFMIKSSSRGFSLLVL